MRLQGWCPDPYGSHEERWFSDGEPTSLVRDQGTESRDGPPPGPAGPEPPYGQPPYGQPPYGQLPRYPAGPPDKLERPTGPWPWWAVCLPGVPTIALSGFLFFAAIIATAMSCFDSCDPAAHARASDVAAEEFVIAILAIVLLVVGLAMKPWRRSVTVALSVALVLVFGFLLLP